MNATLRAGLAKVREFLVAAEATDDPAVFELEVTKARDLIQQVHLHAEAAGRQKVAETAVSDALKAYAVVVTP